MADHPQLCRSEAEAAYFETHVCLHNLIARFSSLRGIVLLPALAQALGPRTTHVAPVPLDGGSSDSSANELSPPAQELALKRHLLGELSPHVDSGDAAVAAAQEILAEMSVSPELMSGTPWWRPLLDR